VGLKNSSFSIRQPLFICIALAGGILLGATIFSHSPQNNKSFQGYQKLKQVLSLISSDYVDTVNTDELVDYSIEKMLEKLDPHTVYIPLANVQAAKSQLESGFDGIGVEFNIFRDTVYVVAPLIGGPSEAIGVQTGDKIVKVDDKPIFDKKKSDNGTVFKKLRGPKGSKVKLGIMRKGVKGIMDFTVTRDKIPNYSVEAAYMIDGKTGYIKVSNFAENTFTEFKQALKELKDTGMRQLILDLRGNPGGYLDRATNMVDELLADGKMIVYTDGKVKQYDSKIRSNHPGIFEKGPIIVLIDEGSASASEIVSGALQDNDRALIVGRRSFGKGLVQMPVDLEDGSQLRLTISRYYTPSGRSIQKPYGKDTNPDDYELDWKHRYDHGEYFHPDSIKFNQKLKFSTLNGRTVYGGGGIMPNFFVPLDTTFNTKYLGELAGANVIREFSFKYYADHKAELSKMPFKTFNKNFTINDEMMKEVVEMGNKAKVKYNQKEYDRSQLLIRNQIKALIARSNYRHDHLGKNNEYYEVMMPATDEIYNKAVNLFSEAQKIEDLGEKKK